MTFEAWREVYGAMETNDETRAEALRDAQGAMGAMTIGAALSFATVAFRPAELAEYKFFFARISQAGR